MSIGATVAGKQNPRWGTQLARKSSKPGGADRDPAAELSRDAAFFFREWAQAQPLMHRARHSLVPGQLDLPASISVFSVEKPIHTEVMLRSELRTYRSTS